MKNIVISLLPWSRQEWSEWFVDLSPLIGIFFFSNDLKTIVVPFYLEMYFLLGFGLMRLATTATYAAWDLGKDMGLADLDVPDPWIGKIFYVFFMGFFGSILIAVSICLILLLIGFNFFFYMLIELFLSVAFTGNINQNFNFFELYKSLNQAEIYFIWGMLTIACFRYFPKISYFFRTKPFLKYKEDYAWTVMGLPKIPVKNEFQKMVSGFQAITQNSTIDVKEYGLVFFFLFLFSYFSILIIMIKLPKFGPVLVLGIKAFVELYFKRLYTPR